MKHHLILGQWNCVCDRCGFEYKSPELRKDWQGLMVCKACYEPRHPQDFIRIKPERGAPPWVRPEPPDTFVNICYIWQQSSYVGLATVGCSKVGNDVIPYTTLYALKMGL